MIDLLVAELLFAGFVILVNAVGPGRSEEAPVFALGIVMAVFCLLEVACGRSLGKWVLRLRVERPGDPDAGAMRLARRFLLKLVILFLPLLFPGGMPEILVVPWILLALGSVLPVVVGDGRAMHDWLAGTVVVRREPEPSRSTGFTPVMQSTSEARTVSRYP